MSEQDQKEIARQLSQWQSRFKLLLHWDIRISDSSRITGQITTNPELPRAVLFPWASGQEIPEDFYFHEILHVALRAYKRIPEHADFDVEEQLVRDICSIYRGAIQDRLEGARAVPCGVNRFMEKDQGNYVINTQPPITFLFESHPIPTNFKVGQTLKVTEVKNDEGIVVMEPV